MQFEYYARYTSGPNKSRGEERGHSMYITIPFDRLDESALKTLTKSASIPAKTHVKAGSSLYFEGDPVEWLYRIETGVLRLSRMLADGRRQVIAFGYPGDVVGFPYLDQHHTDCDVLVEASLQPYRASALEPTCKDPALHQALFQAALREISEIQDHVMMLGQKSAVEKLACFLCTLGMRTGTGPCHGRKVPLPMSRADIADFIGLTTETVSRTLTQFKKDGLISMLNVHCVVIENPKALQALCQRTD